MPLVYLAHYPRRGAGVVGVVTQGGGEMGNAHACARSSASFALAIWCWLWTCGSSWWALEQAKRRGLMPFGVHIRGQSTTRRSTATGGELRKCTARGARVWGVRTSAIGLALGFWFACGVRSLSSWAWGPLSLSLVCAAFASSLRPAGPLTSHPCDRRALAARLMRVCTTLKT